MATSTSAMEGKSPAPAAVGKVRAALGWVASPAISALAAAALVAGWGYATHGTVYALPELARGRVMMVSPTVLELGPLNAGTLREASIDVKNLSGRAITINGLKTSCTCVGSVNLPMEVPAGSDRPIRLAVKPLPAQAGTHLNQDISLYLSVSAPPITFTVRGDVLPPE